MTAEVIIFPVVRVRPPQDVAPAPYRPPISGERLALVERHTDGVPCEDCGELISPRRLKAKPNAHRCLECQTQAENQGWSTKQHKDPRP